MDGKLFSQDFLLDGIKTTPVWESLPDEALNTFIADLQRIYAPLSANSQLNEANTEADIIEKVLDLLGWQDLTLKQVTATSTRRDDVPDFLLFPNEEAKQAARAEKRDDRRYRHGIAIIEAKRWMRPLDRGGAAYILDTFSIVREQDENRVSAEANMSAANVKQGGRSQKAHGRYLTKDLILAYMNAVAAGDFTTVVQA